MGSAAGEVQVERYLYRIAVDPANEAGGLVLQFVFSDVIGFELRDNGRFAALIGMDILRQGDLVVRRDGSARIDFW